MCRRLFISITRHISFHFSSASMEKIYEGPALLQSITLLGLCPGPCPGPYPSLYWTMSVGKLIKEKQRSFLTSTARGMHIQRMSSLRKVPVIKPLQHCCYWWHGLSSSDMMQHIGILHKYMAFDVKKHLCFSFIHFPTDIVQYKPGHGPGHRPGHGPGHGRTQSQPYFTVTMYSPNDLTENTNIHGSGSQSRSILNLVQITKMRHMFFNERGN